jgi:large subunit ribosomal protein L25
MRREGWVPSVIYGRGSENKNLKINAKAFHEMLAHSTSENILINLDIDGASQLAFLKAVQHDSLTGHPLHADFLAIDEKTEITASIPVHLIGEPAGVKAGGMLEQLSHNLEVRCSAANLPEELNFDVTALEEGASLHIGDVKLPEGVVATHAADVVIAHVAKTAAAVSEAAAG